MTIAEMRERKTDSASKERMNMVRKSRRAGDLGRVKVGAGRVVLSVYIQRNQAAPLSLTSAKDRRRLSSRRTMNAETPSWGWTDWVRP
jgi:hypothetical protein